MDKAGRKIQLQTIRAALLSSGAKMTAIIPGPKQQSNAKGTYGGWLNFFEVNGKPLIVQEFLNGEFEIWLPVNGSKDTAEIIAAIKTYLEVK